MRLRGSLFFGPAFLVTRNKLTFRDNLRDLLGAAEPGQPSVRRSLQIIGWHLLPASTAHALLVHRAAQSNAAGK